MRHFTAKAQDVNDDKHGHRCLQTGEPRGWQREVQDAVCKMKASPSPSSLSATLTRCLLSYGVLPACVSLHLFIVEMVRNDRDSAAVILPPDHNVKTVWAFFFFFSCPRDRDYFKYFLFCQNLQNGVPDLEQNSCSFVLLFLVLYFINTGRCFILALNVNIW